MDARFVLLVTSLLVVTSSSQWPSPCGDRENVTVRGGRPQSDGSMLAEDGTRFPPGCYWQSGDNTTSGCTDKINPCLWKCCREHEVMDMNENCHQIDNPLLNTFLPPPKGSFNNTSFHLLHGEPCFYGRFELEFNTDSFLINDNGSLHVVVEDDNDDFFPSGHFCREVLVGKDSARVVHFGCFTKEDLTAKNDDYTGPKHKYLINIIAVCISLPFLLATLVVYAVIPELRNLHGKCLMSHVASLFVAFVCLALIQKGVEFLSMGGCLATALIAYFFLLASFFWLNVMCFDIWWTFSGYRSRIGPKDPRDKEKFIYYSLYAWGAAVVFLCVCATMKFKKDIPEKYVRPDFGDYSCWFYNKGPKWAYFNGPVAVLIGCNLIFFSLTALSMWKIKKQTAVLNEGKDSQRSGQRDRNVVRFKLYLKLFVVMGAPWAMEIISEAVGGPEEIWWFTDVLNLLVGIPIFIIFVWKSKVRQLFMAKLNIKMGSSTDTSAIELT